MANEVQTLIAQTIAPLARKGVDDGVEDELNNVYSGKRSITGIGILDQLIGFIFSLFGPETQRMIAGWMGMHIPTEAEKQKLSDQITLSTSQVLAEVDSEGKFTALAASPDTLRKKVAAQLEQDIRSNPDLKFLSEEQITQAANKAAGELNDKRITELQKNLGVLQQGVTVTVSNEPLVGTPEQQVQQVLGKIVTPLLSEKPEAAQPLIEAGSKVILNNQALLDKPEELAKIFLADEGVRKAAQAAGLNIDSPLAGKLLTQSIAGSRDFLKKAAAGEGVAVESAQAPTVSVDMSKIALITITEEVSEGIKVKAAEKARDKLQEGGFFNLGRRMLRNKETLAAADILNKHDKDPASVSEKEYAAAVDTLYDAAVKWKAAPDNSQRAKAGEIAAQAAVNTLKDASIKPEELPSKLQDSIQDALTKRQPEIDAAGGLSVARINDSWLPMGMGEKGDLLGDIAKGFAGKVTDDDETRSKITEARAHLLRQEVEKVASAMDKSKLTQGLNGEEATEAPAQPGGPAKAKGVKVASK